MAHPRGAHLLCTSVTNARVEDVGQEKVSIYWWESSSKKIARLEVHTTVDLTSQQNILRFLDNEVVKEINKRSR